MLILLDFYLSKSDEKVVEFPLLKYITTPRIYLMVTFIRHKNEIKNKPHLFPYRIVFITLTFYLIICVKERIDYMVTLVTPSVLFVEM